MIIELEKERPASYAQIDEIAQRYGNRLETIRGGGLVDTLHIIGDARELAQHLEYLKSLPGVGRIWRISSAFKNIARKVASEDGSLVVRPSRTVKVQGPDGAVRQIGGPRCALIIGPDSVQTEEQIVAAARAVADLADRLEIRDRVILRAGAFKPRTRPTDFRGLGMEGIRLLEQVREETGLPFVSEVMDHTLVEELSERLDMFQIGTRNAQDFKLLEAVGDSRKPVILKRGFGNDAAEWFSAAEYIANRGNLDIMLCERGVKTMFANRGYNRFTPDFNIITYAKRQTVLPVLFDPSHAAGDDRLVVPNMLASLAYGPAALLMETIHEEAFRKFQLCDARQALAMEPLEAAIRALLAYEQAVEPHRAAAEQYFEQREHSSEMCPA